MRYPRSPGGFLRRMLFDEAGSLPAGPTWGGPGWETVMSQNLRNYTKALYGFDAVVQRVPADRWDAAVAVRRMVCPRRAGPSGGRDQCGSANGSHRRCGVAGLGWSGRRPSWTVERVPRPLLRFGRPSRHHQPGRVVSGSARARSTRSSPSPNGTRSFTRGMSHRQSGSSRAAAKRSLSPRSPRSCRWPRRCVGWV